MQEVKFTMANGRLDLSVAEQFATPEQKQWFMALLSQLESRFVALAVFGEQIEIPEEKFLMTVSHDGEPRELEEHEKNTDNVSFDIDYCENYQRLDPKVQAAVFRRFIAGMLAVEQRLN